MFSPVARSVITWKGLKRTKFGVLEALEILGQWRESAHTDFRIGVKSVPCVRQGCSSAYMKLYSARVGFNIYTHREACHVVMPNSLLKQGGSAEDVILPSN